MLDEGMFKMELAMRRTVFVLIPAIALLIAAGCMVTDDARTNTAGPGTGLKFIDKPLDAFTVLEGEIAGSMRSAIKSSDDAVSSSYHFASGLVTSEYEPDYSGLEKARKADEKRRISGKEIIDKIEKAKITVNAPILDRTELDKLGLYLVWATPLADTQVNNVWASRDMLLLATRDSSKESKLVALNLHNGYARWQYATVRPLDSRPTVGDEIVWASAASTVHAIDADMGSPLWKTRVSFSIASPIYAINERQYVGSHDRAVYAIIGKDRFPDWRFGTFAPISSMPIVTESTLYAGSEDGRLYAFNFTKRENLWQVKTTGAIVADLVEDDKNIYFGCEGFDFYCVSKATGGVAWKFPAQGPIRTAAWLVGQKTVLVRADDSALFALDKATGTEKWHDSDAVKPVALGRFLYVATANNTIKALDIETGKAAWEEPVPQFNFIAANVATDAISLCTRDGQIFLLQEKNGMNLKPEKKAKLIASKEGAPAEPGAVGAPAGKAPTAPAKAAPAEAAPEGAAEAEAPANGQAAPTEAAPAAAEGAAATE